VSDSPDQTRIVAAPRAAVGRLAATVERLADELRAAESGADARALTALACGVLMERLGCGPQAAARQLDELAERSGQPALEIAADLVSQVSGDAVGRMAGDRRRTPPRSPAAVRLRAAESGLLNTPDVHAAARSLKRQALEPLGATAVAVWALSADGSLWLAGHAGFTAAETRRWRHVPPRVATLARRAVVQRAACWTTDADDGPAPSIGLAGARSGADRVAVPAILGGRMLGVLEICWPGPVGDLPPQVHRQLEALAELCAHTLDSGPADGDPRGTDDPRSAALGNLVDGLLDPAMVLHPVHAAGGTVADFRITHVNERFVDPSGRPRAAIEGLPLLQAYPLAAVDGGLFEKIEHVHATGEPYRDERMVLDSLIDQVPISTVAAVGVSRLGSAVILTWRLEDEAARLARLLHHAQRLGRIGGFEEDFVSGETIWNPELFDLFGLSVTDKPVPVRDLAGSAHPDDADEISRFIRAVLQRHTASSVAFRLRRGDGVLRYIRIVAEPVFDESGTATGVRGACQDVSSQHWTEIALAATRDRLEHTEREAAERNRLTLRLQRAIMPATPEPVDAWGLRIAVRYQPAEQGDVVGGDWYDSVILPSKKVLLAVGDVAGHGIDAATDMVALRNALRGLAATGARPSQILGWLNTVAHRMTGDIVTATAVCALYDPQERTLRWATAGHPPPLLVRNGGAGALPMPAGVLLGAMAEPHYAEETLALEEGDVLLMYTDGLIERRDRSLTESLEHLIGMARVPGLSLTQRLDHMLLHSNSDTDDDTCLIGIEVR
jgi:PAS domain S-box-containing protein